MNTTPENITSQSVAPTSPKPPRPIQRFKKSVYNPKATGSNQKDSRGFKSFRKPFKSRRQENNEPQFESKVIEVRRVTRVVKGGKRMRFSALVVVGDRKGKVGFGIKKGLDYQDAVNKATKQAQLKMIPVNINDNMSVPFEQKFKFKACQVYLKPANSGTGLIAGGFIRPVLELAGIKNIYSKILASRNKITGVQAVIKALENYNNSK